MKKRYEIKYTMNKKVCKTYVEGAEKRDKMLKMMRNHHDIVNGSP